MSSGNLSGIPPEVHADIAAGLFPGISSANPLRMYPDCFLIPLEIPSGFSVEIFPEIIPKIYRGIFAGYFSETLPGFLKKKLEILPEFVIELNMPLILGFLKILLQLLTLICFS